MRLLDSRCFELRLLIHEQFTAIWTALIDVDRAGSAITIHPAISGKKHCHPLLVHYLMGPGEITDLDQAVIGLMAYKELDEAAQRLWEDLDEVILKPRTNLQSGTLPSIQVKGVRDTPTYAKYQLTPVELTISGY